MVRDKDTHRQVVEDTARFALDTGFSIRQIDYSPITGPKGNIEFLLLMEKAAQQEVQRYWPTYRILWIWRTVSWPDAYFFKKIIFILEI